jgi:hypothetical protein
VKISVDLLALIISTSLKQVAALDDHHGNLSMVSGIMGVLVYLYVC